MKKKSCSYSTNLRISAFLDFSANRQQRNSRITALRFVYIFLAICPFGWIGATFFHIWNTPNPGGFPTIQEFLFDLFSNNWGTITLFLFNVLIYLFVCLGIYFTQIPNTYKNYNPFVSILGIGYNVFVFASKPIGDRCPIHGNSP